MGRRIVKISKGSSSWAKGLLRWTELLVDLERLCQLAPQQLWLRITSRHDGPDILTIAIPALPGAVESAYIVSSTNDAAIERLGTLNVPFEFWYSGNIGLAECREDEHCEYGRKVPHMPTAAKVVRDGPVERFPIDRNTRVRESLKHIVTPHFVRCRCSILGIASHKAG